MSARNSATLATAILALTCAATLPAQTHLLTRAPGSTTNLVLPPEGAPGAPPQATPKDDLFAGTDIFAKNATGVTEINMGPSALDMVGGPDADKAHRTILNVVHTYSYDKPGMYNMEDVNRFREKLTTGGWECSVHTRDMKTGESTDICSKPHTDGVRETAIITVEPKSLTFIHSIRRSKTGPGQSELGDLPLALGASLPNLAMLDPEAFANLQLALHGTWLNAMNTAQFEALQHLDAEKLKQLDKRLQDKFKNFHPDLKSLPKVPELPAIPAPPAPPARPEE